MRKTGKRSLTGCPLGPARIWDFVLTTSSRTPRGAGPLPSAWASAGRNGGARMPRQSELVTSSGRSVSGKPADQPGPKRSGGSPSVRLTYNIARDTIDVVIRSFRCTKTERLFHREPVKEFANIASVAFRRLAALDAAQAVSDLLIPPSNRLEALSGDRKGQYSIRINDQYRICFTFHEGHAEDAEITKHYR